MRTLAAAAAVFLLAVSLTAQPTCPTPQIVQTGGPNPTCPGVPVTLDAGAGWVSYNWSNGATTRLMTDSPLATTSYFVIATDANGCSAQSQPFQVQVGPGPSSPPAISFDRMNASVTTISICTGATAYAFDQSSTNWATRQWSITNGVIDNDFGWGGISFHATGGGDVVVTLSVTDANGCPASVSATATVHTAATPLLRLQEAKVCPGSSSYVGIDPPPPDKNTTWQNVQWSIVNGTLNYGSNYSAGFTTDPGGQAAVITATATDGFGCTATSSITVPVRTVDPPVLRLQEAQVCPGAMSYAGIDPPEVNGNWTNVQWSIVNGTINYSSNYSVGFTTDPGGQPARITAVATDTHGCTNTASITVPVRSIPPPVLRLQEAQVCPGAMSYAGIDPPEVNGNWANVQWSIVNGTINYSSNYSVSFTTDPGGQPATITAVATDSHGCTNTASIIVPVRSIPPPVLRPQDPQVCAGAMSYVGIDPPEINGYWANVQWSIVNGTINNSSIYSVSFTTDPGGQPVTITAVATDSHGCTNTASVTIPVRSIPPPVLRLQDAQVCPGSQSYVGIDDPEDRSTSWANVQWSIVNGTINNSSNYSVSFTTDPGGQAAQVTAVVTDSRGCTSTATITVPVRVLAPPVIRPYNSIICAGSPSGASVDPPGGPSGTWQSVQWSIQNGTITAQSGRSVAFTADTSGQPVILTVDVVDSSGCRGQSSVSVAEHLLTPPSVYLDNDTTCAGAPNNAHVAPPADPNGTWSSIHWSIQNGTINGPDYLDSVSFSSDAGGQPTTLTVTAIDGIGCQTTTTVTAPVRTITAPEILLDNPSSCAGGMNHAVVKPPNEVGTWWIGYSWTITNGAIVGFNASNSVNFTTDPGGQPATLTVALTDSLGCSTTATITVPLRVITPPRIQLDRASMCAGATNRATVMQPNDPGTWWNNIHWTIANGTIIGADSWTTVDFASDPGGQPATLTATLTDSLGCTTTASATIAIRTITPPRVQLDRASMCAGATNRASVMQPNDPGTWWNDIRWTIAHGTIIGADSWTTVDFASDPGGQPATLTVRATDSLGCTTSTSVTVPLRTITPPRILLDRPASCAGATNHASISQPNEPGTWWNQIRWTIVNGAIVGADWWTTVDFTSDPGGQPATLTATLVDSLGCTTSVSITIPVRTITPPPVYLDFDASCPGGTNRATLWQPNDPGTWWNSVHWTIANGTITGSDSNMFVEFTTDPGGQPATVTATAIDSLGCTTTASASVGVAIAPPLAIASSQASVCKGGSVTVSSTDTRSLHGWSWSVTNGTIVGPSDQSSVVAAPTGTAPMQVSATALQDFDGCTATNSVTVSVNLPPAATITAGGATTFCAGGSVTLTSSPGASYSWSTGATTQSITVASSGSYSVAVTGANGCSATSNATNVTVNALPAAPTITAGGPTAFCPGGSVTLTASSGASYAWSNGATTQAITVSASGAYSVTVTDANGCSAASAPTTVTVNARPTPTITAGGPTAFCAGGSVTLTSSPAASYAWSTGATTQSITVSASGDYSVTVTGANGCSGTSAAVNVFVEPLPVPAISGNLHLCGPGASTTLTASGGQSYVWSTGAFTPSITVTQPGTYSVTVTDSFGCSAAPSSVTVDAFAVTVTPPSASFCAGDAALLSASPAASYLWSTGATTQNIVVRDAGSYSVTATDANGCSLTSSPVAVTVRARPAVTATLIPPRICAGQNFTVHGAVTGGSGTIARYYLWNMTFQPPRIIMNSSTSADFTLMAQGNGGTQSYMIEVDDADGCVADSSVVTETIDPAPAHQLYIDTTGNRWDPNCPTSPVTLSVEYPAEYASFRWSSGETTPSISVTTAGRYTVTATTSGGCVYQTYLDVSFYPMPAKPTITPSGSTSLCPGQSVTLTSSAAASYYWSNGATTQSITLSPGWLGSSSFTVQTTDANGCRSTSDPVVVSSYEAPSPQATAAVDNVCGTTSATLNELEGSFRDTSGDTYLWSNGATTRQTVVTAPGTYHVTVTSAHGCSAVSNDVNVVFNAPLAGNVAAGGPTTLCPGTAVTLTSQISGGVAPYSYRWSTNDQGISGGSDPFSGAPNVTVTPTINGRVTLQVTDAVGCTLTRTVNFVLDVPPTPAVTAGGPTAFCAGGSVTLTAPAGYSYQWSNGATTQSVVVTAQGSYQVTVTNATGCSATSAATAVTVHPLPTPTITAGGPTTFCAGGSVTLTAPSASAYAWSTGATTRSIAVSASGSYSVTVTDAFGCSGTSAAVDVVAQTVPKPAVTASGSTTYCTGGSVTLTAPAGYSYQWSNGATTQSITVSVLGDGSYSVTVRDALGCPNTSDPVVTHGVANPPTPGIGTSGPTTFCAGGSVTLTAPGGYTYAWSTGATTQSISVSSAGAYNVTVTDANGCSASSPATNVTVNAAPPTPAITAGGPTTFCTGGSVTLTAPAGYSYRWSNFQTAQSINVTSAGSYTVTVTDAHGCSATSAATIVTVNANPPRPAITPSGPTTFCAGGSVTLTAPDGYSYRWSNGATTQSITVSSTGNYNVTVTDANGCSSGSLYTTVNVVPYPPATITTSGPTSFCSNDSVTLYAPMGYAYHWSTGATTDRITVSTSGTYSVTVYGGYGCDTTSDPVTVSVRPSPATPTITAGGPTTFCAGGSVSLTSSPAYAYYWSNGASTQSITVTSPGTYTVSVWAQNGCPATSAPITVTVLPSPATPTITAGGPTTFCAGGSVTLTASSASAYSWSNGATTQSITVSASGSYSVTVTDANGCSATSAATTVTVNANPPAPTITPDGPTTFCGPFAMTLNASAGASYLWSTGATTSYLIVTATGDYTVTVTDANGCSATSAPTHVQINPNPPAPTITASGPTTFCDGGSVTLTGPSGYSYSWVTGATTQSITVSNSGAYTLTITDANGCSSYSSVNVDVKPLPSRNITVYGPTSWCGPTGSTILQAGNGASWLWSTGETTRSITVTTAGTYSCTITSADGCTVTTNPVVVTSYALPDMTITPNGPTTFCAGGSVTLSAQPGYAHYFWSTGATTPSINVSTTGDYFVTITTSDNCQLGSSSLHVQVNQPPATPTISTGGSTTFCAGGSVLLTSSSASGNQWYVNNTAIGGATSNTYTATATGSYTVKVTDGNGCTSAASAATSVTVNQPPPTPTISTTGSTTFCAGGNVLLTSSSASGNQWYLDNNPISGATSNTYTATAGGSYTVKVTDANGCTSAASAATSVTVNQPPATPTISTTGSTTFCAGGSVLLTSSSTSGNQWYLNGAAINGATSNSYTATATGSYTVKVTDGNGCTSNASGAVNVTVNQPPAAPTISTGGAQTTFCAGNNILLTSSSNSGNQWYRNGTAISGATNNTYTATASGSYTVKFTDANGCTSADSNAVNVTVNQPPATPTITAGGSTTFCAGGSVVLTSSGASGNQWYLNNNPIGGATSNTYTATATGSYTVKVTDGNGCSATSAATVVTANPLPATPTITAGGPTTFCNGGNVVLTSSSASGNQWYLDGTAIGGATGNTYSAAAGGSYTVRVTDGNSCTSAMSAATVVTENPTITAFGPLTQTVLKGAAAQLITVTATGPTLKYQWYKGTTGNTSQKASSTTNTFNPPTGTRGTFQYWVRVTSGTCTADSATATVTVN